MKVLKWYFIGVVIMVTTVFADSYYETIPVDRTEPVYKTVTISDPHRECWDETVETGSSNGIVGSVLGGATGGILGHQVGGGRGKDVATVAGAIVGTIVGNNLADNSPEYKTVTKCKTVYDSHTEERKTGYYNYFTYNSRIFKRFSKYPLHEVKVRISISY